MKQTWKFKVIKTDKQYPFLIIDDYYTPEEEKLVWQELDYYASWPYDKIDRSEKNNASGKYSDGESKAKGFRFYLDEFYRREIAYCSHILNFQYKQREGSIQNALRHVQPYYSSFVDSNCDVSFISYYEDKDGYDTHWDVASWSQLTWFVKEPRRFDGGDFVLEQPNIKVKLKHNRSILFPSVYKHRVIPVKSHSNMEKGYGRWTLTHFYFWNDEKRFKNNV